MSFTTALSGLNAAQNNLSVTGNNIANANTTGFKKSRSEFADVYASNMGGASKVQPGGGVRVMQVAQQFEQGNIEYKRVMRNKVVAASAKRCSGLRPLR